MSSSSSDSFIIDWSAAIAATQPVVQVWMPPAIDREERAATLDGPDGFAEFERKYETRILYDVARLWQDPHLHRRVKQKSEEWGDLRGKFVTGSRVGDILDINTAEGASRRMVFLDYTSLNPEPFTGNWFVPPFCFANRR